MSLKAQDSSLQAGVVKGLLLLTLVECGLFEFLHSCRIGPSLVKSVRAMFLTNTFLGHLVLGFFLYWLFYFGRWRSVGWRAVVILSGLALEVWLWQLRADEPPVYRWLLLGGGLGLAGLLGVVWELRRTEQRRLHGDKFCCLCLLPLSFLAGGWLANWNLGATSIVYDLNYQASDLTLYRPLSAYLTLKIGPEAFTLLQVVYEVLGLFMTLVQLEFLARPRDFQVHPVLLFYLQGMLALFCYYLVPGVGSACIFPQFPEYVPVRFSPEFPIQPLSYSGLAPKNCFPSMHVTWALSSAQLLYATRPKSSPLLVFFVVATILSVFCVGNHYIVDILGAVPMMVATHALCAGIWGPRRLRGKRLAGFLVAFSLVCFEAILIRDYAGFWYQKRFLLWLLFLGPALASSLLWVFLFRRAQAPSS